MLPDRVPALAAAAGAAVLGLLAAGLLLVLVSLGVHAGRIGDLTGALDPGLVGGVVLVLGCVLLLPNAAVWAGAYAAGPGFAVGTGTGVSPFDAVLGPVPAFPLLAALPQDGSPPPAVRAVLLLPVLAGVLAGGCWSGRCRRSGPGRRRGRHAAPDAARRRLGLAAGAVAAVALALLAALAGGRLGGGYLAAVGPSPVAGAARARAGDRHAGRDHRRRAAHPAAGPDRRLRGRPVRGGPARRREGQRRRQTSGRR